MQRERGDTTDAGLSENEISILKQQIQANIDFAWAGHHDRKFFPINEQIAEEELRIRNSTYLIRERSLEGVNRQDPSHQAIVDAIRRTEDRSSRRLAQLGEFWYAEDETMRQKSGAKWEDLWPALGILDIDPIDPESLNRPHEGKYFTEEEDPELPLNDKYILRSNSKKIKEHSRTGDKAEVPAHTVELFGNEVYFSEEDFETIIANLGISPQVVYQIKGSLIDSLTYTPVFDYRIVVSYKNWLFVSKEWFYHQKPKYRKDRYQEFKYWNKSLLPEVMVQPNRGKDFYTLDELIYANRSADPKLPIH